MAGYRRRDAELTAPDRKQSQLAVEEAFESSNRSKQDVGRALDDLARFQLELAERRLVDTNDAEEDAVQLHRTIEGGYAALDDLVARAEASKKTVEDAALRVRIEAEKELGVKTKAGESAHEAKARQNRKIVNEFHSLKKIADDMREQARVARDDLARAMALSNASAGKAKEATVRADAIQDEAARELRRMEELVASVKKQDRIAHLGWRDAAAADRIGDIEASAKHAEEEEVRAAGRKISRPSVAALRRPSRGRSTAAESREQERRSYWFRTSRRPSRARRPGAARRRSSRRRWRRRGKARPRPNTRRNA